MNTPNSSWNDDSDLSDELVRLAKQIQPEQRFTHELEKQLLHAARHRSERSQNFIHGGWRAIAWVGMLAVILFLAVWGIRNLLPSTDIPASVTAIAGNLAAFTPTVSPDSRSELAPTIFIPTPTPDLIPTEQPVFSSPYFPQGGINLQAGFPSSPPEAMVYQIIPYPELNLENAKARASQFGISSPVYSSQTDNPDEKNYIFIDRSLGLTLLNTPDYFFLTLDPQWYLAPPPVLPEKEQIRLAEEKLKNLGLLDSPYQAQAAPDRPGVVYFYPLLENIPLHFGIAGPPLVSARLNSDGEIGLIMYNKLSYQEVEHFPIISAQKAWEKLIGPEFSGGIEQSQQLPPVTSHTWTRQYPDGVPVELLGPLQILQSIEPGYPPVIRLNSYLLEGQITGIENAGDSTTRFQVFGSFRRDLYNQQVLQIEGWQITPLDYEYLDGVILRQGEQGYLVVGDQRYLLPDLPDDLKDGTQVQVTGIVFQQPEQSLDWIDIFTGQAGGGGGEMESSFLELDLSGGSGATATQLPPPFIAAGEPVEGVQGLLYVTLYQQPDGSLRSEYALSTEPQAGWPDDGFYMPLEGSALAGIDSLHLQPVRIWGSFLDLGAQSPRIQVDRYEPVYPQASYRGWLGTIESVNIAGQTVTRFTAEDSGQYILGNSIDHEPDQQMGNPGDLLAVEGLLVPEETFGGLPVIQNPILIPANDMPEPAAYLAQVGQPQIVPEDTRYGGAPAVIELIELVYVSPDPQLALQSFPIAQPYIQPVWRFVGRYADGQTFEVQVQALDPRYLKP